MSKLRFALFGAGFWAHYQLAGWLETGEVECVAICDPVRAKAEQLGARYGITTVYDDAAAMLAQEKLDFVDICTNVETHYPLAKLAAEHGLSVVCQKPLATTLEESAALVEACKAAGVQLYVNENWRWQHPIRALKTVLDTGRIGKVFRAKLDYSNSFPVFDNQPFLKELEQFIITDIGSHIFDTARFLFGDARSVYCQTQRVHPNIKGEDVATVMLEMASGATVICEMSYATKREHDRFLETYIQVEGEHGSLELAPDFWLRETTDAGTLASRHPSPYYAWANPAYNLAHASIVGCQRNIARALKGLEAGEITGEDNLKTVTLMFKAYESAAEKRVIQLS